MSEPPAAEVTFRSDMSVELVKASASDSDVLFAARVSTKGEQSLDDVGSDAERSKGLINYLMRDRHGCYDAQTEVLTGEGWKAWPEVTGDESFLTLSPEGRVEYQRAQRLVVRPHDGPMIRVQMPQLDLLVTPDHRMLAQRRRQPRRLLWELVPAEDLLTACHRMRTGGGEWAPEQPPARPGVMALLGFFIGGGHSSGGTPTFRLRTQRELEFLHARAAEAHYAVTGNDDRYHLLADEEFRLLAKSCYDPDGAKVIPEIVLEGPATDLHELLDGLMHSDGGISATGKWTYVTTSHRLAGQLQELAVKLGRSATIARVPRRAGDAHLGRRQVYRVTIHRQRNLTPRVGWTPEERARQVRVEHYTGEVYCVTVPNGTLYVRRNGKPAWSGNSPFEHNSMTFYVSAPIFVFREFMRHRIASYNEESGRYRQLRPVFYLPGPARRLVQQGKPGAYEFVEGSPEQHALAVETIKASCRQAYQAYLDMLEAGVAREVARSVLPVGIYSSMYVTMNARALMNFLSLRTKRPDSRFPSFPQREIEMVAEAIEAEWQRLMPLTHAAFEANGRYAP